MQGARFAFGPFVLDPEAGTLLRNEDPVAVGHRGVRLLAAFVGRPGEILAKTELMDAAWPGTAVEEGNLTVQIAQLRKLLGPAADGGEWISTVPRIGYRFTGTIRQLGGEKRKHLALPDKPSIAVLPFLSFVRCPRLLAGRPVVQVVVPILSPAPEALQPGVGCITANLPPRRR